MERIQQEVEMSEVIKTFAFPHELSPLESAYKNELGPYFQPFFDDVFARLEGVFNESEVVGRGDLIDNIILSLLTFSEKLQSDNFPHAEEIIKTLITGKTREMILSHLAGAVENKVLEKVETNSASPLIYFDRDNAYAAAPFVFCKSTYGQFTGTKNRVNVEIGNLAYHISPKNSIAKNTLGKNLSAIKGKRVIIGGNQISLTNGPDLEEKSEIENLNEGEMSMIADLTREYPGFIKRVEEILAGVKIEDGFMKVSDIEKAFLEEFVLEDENTDAALRRIDSGLGNLISTGCIPLGESKKRYGKQQPRIVSPLDAGIVVSYIWLKKKMNTYNNQDLSRYYVNNMWYLSYIASNHPLGARINQLLKEHIVLLSRRNILTDSNTKSSTQNQTDPTVSNGGVYENERSHLPEDLKKITASELEEIIMNIKNNYPNAQIDTFTPNNPDKTGLPFEIEEVIDFIYGVDTQGIQEIDQRKERSLRDNLKHLEHVIGVISELESRMRERGHKRDVNLSDILWLRNKRKEKQVQISRRRTTRKSYLGI